MSQLGQFVQPGPAPAGGAEQWGQGGAQPGLSDEMRGGMAGGGFGGGQAPALQPGATPGSYRGASGDVQMQPGGQQKITLNDQGRQKYKVAAKLAQKRFGKYPGMDRPDGVHPEIIPGKPFFNPFPGGAWGR